MRILERIRQWFRPENRISMPLGNGLAWLPAFEAGLVVHSGSALQVSAVWGCIDVIARALAPRPWNVYEVAQGKRSRRPDDRVSYLLNARPNPDTTAIAFRECMLYSCMAFGGNGYAEIQFDGAMRPVALWPLEPQRVSPMRDGNGPLFYRVQQYGAETIDVPASRIFHLRGPSIQGFVGENILAHAAKCIAIGAAAQQFSASYFANGTVASGVLKHPAAISQAAVEKIRAQFAERYQGPSASHKPLVLEEGMDWKSLTTDPDKMQLIDTRRFSVFDIARYFGVPLHKIQDPQGSQGYGTNVEQLGIQFVTDTVEPWARRLEQEADEKLFPDRRPARTTSIDLSRLTQGDFKTRMEGYEIAKRSGTLTTNEVREREGWNDIGPDGDVFLVQGAPQTLDRVLRPPSPVVAAPATEEEDEEEEEETRPGMDDPTRRAAIALFTDALEVYGHALARRADDLARLGEEKAAPKMEAERERQRARLLTRAQRALEILRLGPSAPGVIVGIAEAVEQGEPPALAAGRLVEKLQEPI